MVYLVVEDAEGDESIVCRVKGPEGGCDFLSSTVAMIVPIANSWVSKKLFGLIPEIICGKWALKSCGHHKSHPMRDDVDSVYPLRMTCKVEAEVRPHEMLVGSADIYCSQSMRSTPNPRLSRSHELQCGILIRDTTRNDWIWCRKNFEALGLRSHASRGAKAELLLVVMG